MEAALVEAAPTERGLKPTELRAVFSESGNSVAQWFKAFEAVSEW